MEQAADDETARRKYFEYAIQDGAFAHISNPARFFRERQRAVQTLAKPASSSSSSSSASSAWKTEMCISVVRQKRCPYGDSCHFAHSQEELRIRKRTPRCTHLVLGRG